MTDARTVIANIKQRVYALHGGTVEAKLGSALAADILAALAEAGLEIVRAHKWFTPKFIGYECCAECGIVKRADGRHRPCPGRVTVGPRKGGSE